jgi:hypothetical protein
MPLVETKIEGVMGTVCLDHFEKRNSPSGAQTLGEHSSIKAKNRPAACATCASK